MYIRFRQKTAEKYGDGERECAGDCINRPRLHVRGHFFVRGRTFLKGCPRKPICPLTEKRMRLEVSIVETRRDGSKVKQAHVASLGSIAGDSLVARATFWHFCEERLARLGNRLGPDVDRLRQAIAARIPLLTNDDKAALDAAEWERLEAGWDGFAEHNASTSTRLIETAEKYQHLADAAKAMTLQARKRESAEAHHKLNMQLGQALAMACAGSHHDEG